MEDVIQKMKDGISSKLAGSPARTDTLKAFENLKESGYDDNFELTIDFLDFLLSLDCYRPFWSIFIKFWTFLTTPVYFRLNLGHEK